MYLELREFVAKTCSAAGPGASALALSIGESRQLLREVGLAHVAVVDADFPEHDMRDLAGFADEAFDIVVSDQVLQHIEYLSTSRTIPLPLLLNHFVW